MDIALSVLLAIPAALTTYLAIVTLSNLSSFRSLRRASPGGDGPLVSVLVPARDEERNIRACVESLLAQSHRSIEVLVLDDHSTDGTADVVREMAAGDARVRLLTGAELPGGWLGKHWACHQLSQAAPGDLLLFVDADTTLERATVADAVASMRADGAALVSLLPTRVPCSWLDTMVFLVIDWAIHSWLPFTIAYRTTSPALSVSFGQFMLFTREAYGRIGGYEGVRQHVVDDVELGRRIKAAKLTWRLYDGSGRAMTRMYTTASEVMDGLAKNIFRFFGRKVWALATAWVLGMALAVAPIAVLVASAVSDTGAAPVALAGVTVGLLLATWLVACMRFGHGAWRALLYPFAIATTLQVALWSMVRTLQGRTNWKGRAIMKAAP
ncbi:MAG: glycosyltransferase [SAR202 cluster bacterium]|nr:glycosyltransferase [SAR202 cluster bacterium]